MSEHVSKTVFKAKALEYFRRVESTGETLIITDHGQPMVEIRPIPKMSQAEKTKEILESLRGSVLHYEDPFEPVGLDDWEALKE
jgi:prevent-host-death family protein